VIWGSYDILFYPPLDHVGRWYRRWVPEGKRKRIVYAVEGVAEQIRTEPAADESLRMMRVADATTAINPCVANDVRREFGLEVTAVIPTGYDASMFEPVDRLGHRPPVNVLTVASIQPRKRIETILDLARAIEPSEAQFHIVGGVIGAADYRDSLSRRIVEENLKHVHLCDAEPQEKIRVRMGDADVFVLPSRLEGEPKVLQEAAATGLPCVAFRDYGPLSIMDGVTGFTVGTDGELLARLRELIADPGLRQRMGRAGSDHVRQFGWDKVAHLWEPLFEDVMRFPPRG
jgi:glycosyltransferase involved in cell wall biosynthesis